MKRSPDLNHVLEIFWLIVAFFTAIIGIYSLVKHGFRSAYMFFIMTVLSFLLYLARHNLRLRKKE